MSKMRTVVIRTPLRPEPYLVPLMLGDNPLEVFLDSVSLRIRAGENLQFQLEDKSTLFLPNGVLTQCTMEFQEQLVDVVNDQTVIV